MTVRQLLDYCRPFYPTWDRELERTLLTQFDLPVERKLKHLSRGMLMKVALLAVLAYRPKLLVLDEPFSGLDPIVRDEFTQGILEASGLGEWTVFISSHDIEEVERLADHVGLIDRGRTKLVEAAESLLQRFRRVEVNLLGHSPAMEGIPAEWLAPDREGDRVTFVDSGYSAATTEALCEKHFPAGTFTAHPMSLREIFIMLNRNPRNANKGVPL